jgi:hypothetical protein
MKLKNFITKHNIKLSKPVYRVCAWGEKLMARSVDPLHDLRHVERMVGLMDKNMSGIRKQAQGEEPVNFEVMLLAIYWHDTWKAERDPKNIYSMAYGQLMEGVLCARKFRKYARKVGLDKDLIKNTAYVIRKHSQLQVLPTRTVEARILKDLDKLEKWNYERFKAVREESFVFDSRVLMPLFRLYMSLDGEAKLYYEWAKEEFRMRRTVYFDKLMEVS